MEKVIIGVDAGGTKTTIGLINEQIELIYQHVAGSGSPAVVGDQAFLNIHEGIQHVMAYTLDRFEVTAIAMGVSGLGVIKNKRVYEEKFTKAFNRKTIIESDAALALYSLVQDKYDEGVVVLSGTGSSVMGIKGTKMRLTEGWGHLLAEAGSAYAIVRDFMRIVIGVYEREDRITPLCQLFMDYMHMDNIEEFKVFMYHSSKKEVAKHAMFFAQQAQLGEKEAIALFEKAGYDLAEAVKNVFVSLKLSCKAVLGYRGGMITNAQITQDTIAKELKRYGITYRLIEAKVAPIFGAYYMVKRLETLC